VRADGDNDVVGVRKCAPCRCPVDHGARSVPNSSDVVADLGSLRKFNSDLSGKYIRNAARSSGTFLFKHSTFC
jgi:hypothetical protein